MFAGNLGEAQNLENVMSVAERLKNNKHIQWFLSVTAKEKMGYVVRSKSGDG